MEKNYPLYESEPTPETELDIKAILEALSEAIREFDFNIDLDNEDELERLLGEDNTDFLGNLKALAVDEGIDPEQFFERLGIAVERMVDTDAQTE